MQIDNYARSTCFFSIMQLQKTPKENLIHGGYTVFVCPIAFRYRHVLLEADIHSFRQRPDLFPGCH